MFGRLRPSQQRLRSPWGCPKYLDNKDSLL
jgi:hypothetical protein